MASILRDPSLAHEGQLKIQWVRDHMPLLAALEQRFIAEQPFAGRRIALSIHMEAKTARMALLFQAGGAEVFATGCNPLSTQDDVAAGLAQQGVQVAAIHGVDAATYHAHLLETLRCVPDIYVDDGGDLTQILIDERPDLACRLIGGTEETTTGVHRLYARAAAGQLPYPMIAVNDAQMKYLFDNRYGTGQSVWDGIMRSTNLIVASKTVVIAGYGWCGKGAAMRAKGLGARVIVCEVNPVRAVEAAMDGFTVMPMREAAPLGDLFLTVTGCCDVIGIEHVARMKDGAILCNAGHFDVEVNVRELTEKALRRERVRNQIEALRFADGKTVYLLAEGRLVNLAAGDGHPAEIMDISFALQALSCEYLARHGAECAPGIHQVPESIDQTVAQMKLAAMGMAMDALTPAQEAYLHSANG